MSWLPSDEARANVAVVIEASTPAEVAPLVMIAYGLPRAKAGHPIGPDGGFA
jgi:hypothetical protein